jgi:C-terminal processing protease CtpA/Prc
MDGLNAASARFSEADRTLRVSSPLYFPRMLAQFEAVMTRFGIYSLAAVFLLMAVDPLVSRAETSAKTPDFQEVYQLIKTHSKTISEAELNRAAVNSLLSALSPKVLLVTNDLPQSTSAQLLSKTNLFNDSIAYFRVTEVSDGLAKKFNEAFQQVSSTNKLNGVVLDLRYAGGVNYDAACAFADLFLAKAEPLLNPGSGMISSHEKNDAIQMPLAILVNSGTTGSSEALAAVLRSTGAGLILGSKTAGEALAGQEFTLKTGEKLRLATTPVTLGNGSVLSTNGIQPDIDVLVNPADETLYYADSFYVVRKTNQLAGARGINPLEGTNANVRFGEAELVRQHRAHLDRDSDEPLPAHEPEPETPLVSDPALARALDLLKGLAVVRQSRS